MNDTPARKRRRTEVSSHAVDEVDTPEDYGAMDYEAVYSTFRVPSAWAPVPALHDAHPNNYNPSASPSTALDDGRGPKRTAPAHPFGRLDPCCVADPSNLADDDAASDHEHAQPKAANHWKSTSAAMDEFLGRCTDVLDALLAREFNAHASSSCCSSGNPREYRCVDCYCSLPLCKACIVAAHVNSPFHHIQHWTGSYFARYSLCRLGATLCLGHGGAPCPHARSPISLVAVHTNGVHRLNVVYCECAPRPINPLQLLGASLYPATWETPATVFTVELLNRYHLESLHSKTPAHDFWAVLQALTDNTRTDAVPDRYEELLRVSREWRMLTRWKRSGQALGISALLPNGSTSTALLCPACPQPGLNMEPDWDMLVNDDNCHVYTVFIGIDGNFHAVLKSKKFDPNDRPLLDGHGYFAATDQFADYLGTNKSDDPEEHQSTCANLKSMKAFIRRKGIVVSGVAVVFCRHSNYLPGAMVDLEVGEKFRTLDYAVAQALRSNPHPRLRRVLTCDKGCQYGVKLVSRFESTFQDLVPIVKPMKVLVPKMHLQGHNEDCRYRYSLNYTPKCGRTDGEYVERPWLEINETSKITRDQNPGHRKDTFDDTNHAWNYRKGMKMASALLRNLRKIYVKTAEAADNLDALSHAVGPEKVAEWSRENCEPQVDGTTVRSVYRADRSKLPKFKDVSAALQLLNASGSRTTNQDPTFCPTSFVESGLELEQSQIALREFMGKLPKNKPLSRDQRHDLCLRRRHLRDDITTFRMLQQIHMPMLGPTPDNDVYTAGLDEDFACPEDEPLNLPSEFASPTERQRFGFTELAGNEYTVRLVWAAHDLARMRAAIHAHLAFLSWKNKNVSGQRRGTRAQSQVDTNEREINKHAASYRRHYAALANLGIKPEDARWYRPLLDHDLANLHVHAGNPEGLGQSQKAQAWFWGGDRDASEAAVKDIETLTLEDIRVRWFRARANKDRYSEEVDILHAEIARTHRMFVTMKGVWSSLAELQCTDAATQGGTETATESAAPQSVGATAPNQPRHPVLNRVEGRRAYALKQASMYAQREWDANRSCTAAEDLKNNFAPAQKPTGRRKDRGQSSRKYSYEWSYYTY